MIPLRDDNPTILRPIVTVALIVLNGAVFFYELSLGPEELRGLFYRAGIVPAALVYDQVPGAGGPPTVITSMFLHGGWMHLIGNMLYLWIFGNNIEDSMGHVRFVLFYTLAGLVAAAAHIVVNPLSQVPTIGASGAVSGVLGAYLILFPHARILTLIPLGWFWRVIYLPAWVLLFFWIALQLLNQALDSTNPVGGGVAYAAHIGGFAAGVVFIPFFRKYRRRTQFRYH